MEWEGKGREVEEGEKLEGKRRERGREVGEGRGGEEEREGGGGREERRGEGKERGGFDTFFMPL